MARARINSTKVQIQAQPNRSDDQASGAVQSSARDRDDDRNDNDSDGRRGLTGTWEGTASYNEFDYSFKFLSTFGEEGTFVAASEGDIILDFNAANSAQHGVWTKKGHDEFALKYRLLVSDLTTGVLLATIQIRVRIELLSKDRWRGRFTQDEFYPTGEEFFNTASGTLEAKRIKL